MVFGAGFFHFHTQREALKRCSHCNRCPAIMAHIQCTSVIPRFTNKTVKARCLRFQVKYLHLPPSPTATKGIRFYILLFVRSTHHPHVLRWYGTSYELVAVPVGSTPGFLEEISADSLLCSAPRPSKSSKT